MKVLVPGHQYDLEYLDGDGSRWIQFVDRGHGRDCPGTTCQEVLRALIDRVKFLDAELPWQGNALILDNLRHALTLFEVRAFLRRTGNPENIPTDPENGHWKFPKEDNGDVSE